MQPLSIPVKAGLVVLIALASIAVWPVGQAFGYSSSDVDAVRYLATSVSVAVLGFSLLALRDCDSQEKRNVIFVLALASLALLFPWFSEGTKSYDYTCYELGAKQILAHQNPYAQRPEATFGQVFGYAPPLAQVLAGAHTLFASGTDEASWQRLYLCFQFSQMGTLLACLWMTFRWLSGLGSRPLSSACCAAVVFVLSYPIRETIFASQVNFMLLFALLAFLLSFQTRPYLAGLMVGCATCLKPFLFGLPIAIIPRGRLRPILGMAIAAEIILIHMYFNRDDMVLWQQYLTFLHDYRIEYFWANLSPTNIVAMLGIAWNADTARTVTLIHLPAWILSAILVWRMFKRRRARSLYCSQIFDMVALALVLSPKVWYHHFVLALPLLAFVLMTNRERSPYRTLLAVVLTETLSPPMSFPLVLVPWLGLGCALSLLPVKDAQ